MSTGTHWLVQFAEETNQQAGRKRTETQKEIREYRKRRREALERGCKLLKALYTDALQQFLYLQRPFMWVTARDDYDDAHRVEWVTRKSGVYLRAKDKGIDTGSNRCYAFVTSTGHILGDTYSGNYEVQKVRKAIATPEQQDLELQEVEESVKNDIKRHLMVLKK